MRNKDSMIENWLPIPEYPGYEVSDLGRIRRGDKIRKGTPTSDGYLRVSFWADGKAIKVSVAKLVAAAFLGPRPPGAVIRHGANGKTDNGVHNLSYGTPIENEADKAAHGTVVNGTKHHSNKLSEHDVLTIRRRYVPRDKQNSLHAIARDYGLSAKTVQQIVRREIWKHVA